MVFRARKEKPEKEESKDTRWSQVLQEVDQEYKTGEPWWRRVGVFFAWAGGFAGATAVLAAIILLIVDLFSRDRLFTARNLSDWIFWSAVILMLLGLLAPTASDRDTTSGDKRSGNENSADRRTRLLRKRLRRVYDPWRWRLWAAAILAVGFAALVGLLI